MYTRLYKERSLRGWSRVYVSMQTGISVAQLYELETGQVKNPQKYTAYELQKMFNIPIEELMKVCSEIDKSKYNPISVRAFITKNNIKTKDIADRVQMSRGNINRYISGKTAPSPHIMNVIAKMAKVPYDHIEKMFYSG